MPGRVAIILIVAALSSVALRAQARKAMYSAEPNHLEIVDRALELALQMGFAESSPSIEDIRDRLRTGAYEEDFAPIPGIVGEHFPSPWTQGPTFDFYGLIGVARIPYGELTDPFSGWARGLSHGYDPGTHFRWPGARGTPLEWAASAENTFSWDHAISLYREGKKSEAYECLGHILHLLMDQSVPSHVKVVNHGGFLNRKGAGSLLDPDLASVIVDEYERALAGGLEISGVVGVIPDLLGTFRTALLRADSSRVPRFATWTDYLQNLALVTAGLSVVNTYYQAPTANGEFGQYKQGNGEIVLPGQFGGPTPPAKIGDRWTQFGGYSTAAWPGGTIIPQDSLVSICDTMVPKAAEYCAGLILFFELNVVTEIRDKGSVPSGFMLFQNYPNPFNPSTVVRVQLPGVSDLRLRVFDCLGREIAKFVEGRHEAGTYSFTFDGAGLPSGVYLCIMQAGDFGAAHRMLLMR